MPGPFTFTGHSPLGYMDYLNAGSDEETAGRMLLAEPGESYEIRPVNEGAPVPPNDGRWDPPYVPPEPAAEDEQSAEDEEPPDGAPPPVPPVPPVPALPKDGDKK